MPLYWNNQQRGGQHVKKDKSGSWSCCLRANLLLAPSCSMNANAQKGHLIVDSGISIWANRWRWDVLMLGFLQVSAKNRSDHMCVHKSVGKLLWPLPELQRSFNSVRRAGGQENHRATERHTPKSKHTNKHLHLAWHAHETRTRAESHGPDTEHGPGVVAESEINGQ